MILVRRLEPGLLIVRQSKTLNQSSVRPPCTGDIGGTSWNNTAAAPLSLLHELLELLELLNLLFEGRDLVLVRSLRLSEPARARAVTVANRMMCFFI
jgi:hypothetical protein